MSKHEAVRREVAETTDLFRDVRRMDAALRIRDKMREKGLRNSDVARRLAVSEAAVSRWLRGNQNLTLDTIHLLCDAIQEPLYLSVGAPAGVAESGPSIAREVTDGTYTSAMDEVESSASCNVVSMRAYVELRGMGLRPRTAFEQPKSGSGLNDDARSVRAVYG